jgi:hypothetical protein
LSTRAAGLSSPPLDASEPRRATGPPLRRGYRDGCEIIERAASKNKELVVVEGWSHYDLYDKPEPVRQALEKLVPFYKSNL